MKWKSSQLNALLARKSGFVWGSSGAERNPSSSPISLYYYRMSSNQRTQMHRLLDCLNAQLISSEDRQSWAALRAATTASPSSDVDVVPPRSGVLIPASKVVAIASSIDLAASGMFNEYLNIMATERIMPTGLIMPFPAISGAEPVHTSQIHG